MQVLINLDRNYGGGPRGELGGERAGACANFEHHVVRAEIGPVDQQFKQVQVDEKILAMAAIELEPHLAEPLGKIGNRLSGKLLHGSIGKKSDHNPKRERGTGRKPLAYA